MKKDIRFIQFPWCYSLVARGVRENEQERGIAKQFSSTGMYGIVKAMALDRTNLAPGLYSVLRGEQDWIWRIIQCRTIIFHFISACENDNKKVDPLFLSDLSEQADAFQMNSAQPIQSPFLKSQHFKSIY